MKNKIISTVANVFLVIFLLAVCCLDSDSWLPLIVVCITGAWLTAFFYANHWFV